MPRLDAGLRRLEPRSIYRDTALCQGDRVRIRAALQPLAAARARARQLVASTASPGSCAPTPVQRVNDTICSQRRNIRSRRGLGSIADDRAPYASSPSRSRCSHGCIIHAVKRSPACSSALGPLVLSALDLSQRSRAIGEGEKIAGA
jgi:hypothetical protein